MKAIMVMFDSLNRHFLPPYGCDWTHAPNFQKLAQRAVTFDNAYVGSLPCMPARREIHTGRYNFLHRSWSPLEPYDDSMPEILKQNGIRSHLISDHYHYWEDGGCNYHTRYSSWEISRGQEGDPWKTRLGRADIPKTNANRGDNEWDWQDRANRTYMGDESDWPSGKTFSLAEDFLRTNADQDDWFLQVETFDPHEPFFAPEAYRKLYEHRYDGPHRDWPSYEPVSEDPETVEHMRKEYAALLSFCDAHMGRVLSLMDELDLWKDTLLIVNTDHGFLLGEHGWWAKCRMPFYTEHANIPLFCWDPRAGLRGERRASLVQTIDLPATVLEYFNLDRPADMQGRPLRDTIATDAPVRDAGLFGQHGAHVNVTDGRYVYMRAAVDADNKPLYNYTLMPTHMRGFFSPGELKTAELAAPFSFTKGLQTLRTEATCWCDSSSFGTLLFDLEDDPFEATPIRNPEIEQRMIGHLVRLMKENDAPTEQFVRLGLQNEA